MNDQPLHTKYRPASFDEIIGNQKTIVSLKSLLGRKEGMPHSFLFSGPSGCGKTTFARIMKTELGCSDRDFAELNMSNTRGIDAIRSMITNCKYAPIDGPCKIYLLDEAHKITPDGQHAILKVLEDTPSHVYFIICTTEPEKLLKTIRSRCTKYQVASQRKQALEKLIKQVLKEEGISDFSEDAIKEIANVSEGAPRNALVVLDSVIDIEDDKELLETIIDFSIKQESVLSLCRALLDNKKWSVVAKVLKDIDGDAEKIRYAVLGWMNSVLLKSENDRAAFIIENFLESCMYSGRAGITYAAYISSKK
jgi:DNA polymerase III gamma/tau subunit